MADGISTHTELAKAEEKQALWWAWKVGQLDDLPAHVMRVYRRRVATAEESDNPLVTDALAVIRGQGDSADPLVAEVLRQAHAYAGPSHIEKLANTPAPAADLLQQATGKEAVMVLPELDPGTGQWPTKPQHRGHRQEYGAAITIRKQETAVAQMINPNWRDDGVHSPCPACMYDRTLRQARQVLHEMARVGQLWIETLPTAEAFERFTNRIRKRRERAEEGEFVYRAIPQDGGAHVVIHNQGHDASAPVLEDVKGVGADLAAQLDHEGYFTVSRLAEADPSALAEIHGIGHKTAPKLIEAARELLRASAEESRPEPVPKDRETLFYMLRDLVCSVPVGKLISSSQGWGGPWQGTQGDGRRKQAEKEGQETESCAQFWTGSGVKDVAAALGLDLEEQQKQFTIKVAAGEAYRKLVQAGVKLHVRESNKVDLSEFLGVDVTDLTQGPIFDEALYKMRDKTATDRPKAPEREGQEGERRPDNTGKSVPKQAPINWEALA